MNATDQQQAKIAATAIMERMNRVTEVWEMLDRYKETGSLEIKTQTPVQRKLNEMSRGELIRFCFTIHPTLSKLKKRLAKAKDDAQKAELQAEIAIRNLELQELYEIRDNG